MVQTTRPEHLTRPTVAPVLIEARGLGLVLGGRTILDHVSLSVRRGQVVVVIGPN
jgi:ABC-type transporter Mla maintaining outer membrane lipid asymmetry ATPase subunit MlaF